MYKLKVKTYFSAAHCLEGYPGACQRIHGHNWDITACFSSDKLNELGMVEDFNVLKKELNMLIEKLDHRLLNEIEPFDKINPTSENIARWLFENLENKFKNVHVLYVEVSESSNSFARYEK
ncbi:MAG: 6-carboxytetrahydropterin synthase QueD [Candidatus Coatesbacteria bacterium]|nr:6-carboxytetrahydropterin synthase QueD [Candidatus Coatesbacteria bacterium]